MKPGSRLLDRIAALVQDNDHGEAVAVAARGLGLKDLAERVEHINRQHIRLGHLPRKLYEKRHDAYMELMDFAKRELSPAEYQRFYQVF